MAKFRQFLEQFYDTFKTPASSKLYYPHDTFEVYKNPTGIELKDLYENSIANGVRIGLDKSGNFYVWPDNISHAAAEQKMKMRFALKLEYTKKNKTIYLSSAESIDTTTELKKVLNKRNLTKLKRIFPLAKEIEMSRQPFEKLLDI